MAKPKTITITFPDGTKKQYPHGTTALDVAKSISEGLARAALDLKVNDLSVVPETPLEDDCTFKVITFKDKEGQDALHHSCAHLLAAAVMELWPDTKRTIGPSIEDGFYYDFEFSKPVTADDFPKIEKKMKEILPSWKNFERHELTAVEAKKEYPNNQYKHELITEFSAGGKKVSFYKSGAYWDLCRGGHILNPEKHLQHFKLLSVAGAYWRGDSKNTMLTRIYATAFPEKKDLNEYITRLEEAKKRDHRKLGRELELFMFNELSPGAPFFYPKGALIFNTLLSFLRDEYRKRGYQEVITPQLYHKSLWETSGHWEHYRENMFLTTVEGQEFSLKPMNCPSHLVMYKQKLHSYRELPLRIADFCALHRNELSGVLSGLTRVRKFCQDDAHIFVTEEHIESEVLALIDFAEYIYKKIFNFECRFELSTKPEKAMGSAELWKKAEHALENALKKKKLAYKINAGDGAFYGPKIDMHVKDALGRSWQLATIQLDFNLPQRFDATYEGADGKKHNVIMIHRALLGSLERFIGILTEHFAGKFPLWISPTEVKILTVADRHIDYAQKVYQKFFDAGFHVEIDGRPESIPKKVREAQLEQWNYILVVGDKEIADGTVNVRTRKNEIVGEKKVEALVKELKEEVQRKEIK